MKPAVALLDGRGGAEFLPRPSAVHLYAFYGFGAASASATRVDASTASLLLCATSGALLGVFHRHPAELVERVVTAVANCLTHGENLIIVVGVAGGVGWQLLNSGTAT